MHARSRFALDALNFSLADVRDGLGPYLAIYLIAERGPSSGWDEATAGTVMTIAAIAGLVVQTPAGAWIDRSKRKRALLVGAALLVSACCLVLPWLDSFAAVAATQSLAAVAASVFAPAVTAITLGIVGPRAFARRMGRNEAFNHAGNAASAALAGVLAYSFGPLVVFWLMALLAALSIGATLSIPRADIDDARARGDGHTRAAGEGGRGVPAWRLLIQHRPLRWFCVSVALFHLSNAAMLTSVGEQLASQTGPGRATSMMALCIVAAQCVMVPIALLTGRLADSWGRKPLFLLGFGVLAARGGLYTLADTPSWLVAVQCLDGVGAGVYGVLFPIVVDDLTAGSGHFNLAQGVAGTAQGLGAALSAVLAGALIVSHGYHVAYVVLAVLALAGLSIYALAVPETRGELYSPR